MAGPLLRAAAELLLAAAVLLPRPAAAAGSLTFVTNDGGNDVFSLLRAEHGAAIVRQAASADAALQAAAAGDTILFLADDYPHSQLAAPALAAAADDRDKFWQQAAAKGVKVFLEFPAELPRNATGRKPNPKGRTAGGLPCLPRPAAVVPGMAVNFTYLNRDRSLCAAADCKGGQVQTYFDGQHCGVRDQLIWNTFATPKGTLPPASCRWNRTNAPEYAGTGCGVAPVDGGVNNCGENVTDHLPVIFCPPAGFDRSAVGPGRDQPGGTSHGTLSVDACAAVCRHAAGCSAFTVSDAAVCETFDGVLQGSATKANTSTYRKVAAHKNATKPPVLQPIRLKSWQALRPTTGAQPAAYQGVLAPRLPEAVAAGWARAGMPPLGIFMHHAAQSTLPESWPLYAPQYCHSVKNDTWRSTDCSIETGAVVHAYSTIAAGFDRAVFGIDTLLPAVVPHPSEAGIGNVPLLYSFSTTHGVPVFVAATKISDLIKHRYAPRDHWQAVWNYIVQEFAGQKGLGRTPSWTPAVGPSFGSNASLPPTFRTDAVRKATEWFFEERGPTACDPAPCRDYNQTTSPGMGMFYRGAEMCGTRPDLPADVKANAICVIEGVNGVLFPNGTQMMLAGDRDDCNAEAAMSAAMRAALEQLPGGNKTAAAHFATIGKGLLRTLFTHSGAQINSSYQSWGHVKGYAALGPEECPEGGCISTGPRVPRPPSIENFYSDDNSRITLGAIAAVNLLDSSDHDADILSLAFALLRTTGPDGFRAAQLHFTSIESNGWQHFFDTPGKDRMDNPHFIAQLWANFFWAHKVTGIEWFKTQALKGLAAYMASWPKIVATESLTEELIRLLLPLAWRVRVEDTPAHRAELRECWAALKKTWAWAGVPTCTMSPYGQLCPSCTTNQCYGNGERSVCQETGDPASDVLYESNYLLLNLQEAFAATGEHDYAQHAEQLAQYIARIQASSTMYPQYHGTWFRGFDYSRWEVFGSNADWGWPAFGIETGWTVTWVTAGLGIHELPQYKSFWELITARDLSAVAGRLCPEFFEANATVVCAKAATAAAGPS